MLYWRDGHARNVAGIAFALLAWFSACWSWRGCCGCRSGSSWSAFNQRDWTVLFAVAAVGLAALLLLVWFIASLMFRWRFRFSIRSLLMLTFAIAIPCSWLAMNKQQVKRQREAAAAIGGLGGIVDWSYPSGTAWLRSLLGNDCFGHVYVVELSMTPGAQQAGLEHLKGLNQLEVLWLGNTQVSDVGARESERAEPPLQCDS